MSRTSIEAAEDQSWVLAFTDESNRAWEVREIREPILPERARLLLRHEYSAGWLLFVSGEERRRLAPYPPGWRLADPARLRCWVNDALPVRTTRGGDSTDGACDLPHVSDSPRDSA
jgi:hypothetical protein